MIETIDEYLDRIQKHNREQVKQDDIQRRKLNIEIAVIIAVGIAVYVYLWWL